MLLAEDSELSSQLKKQGILTQTLNSLGQARAHGEMVHEVTVLPAKLLGEAYQYLGKEIENGLWENISCLFHSMLS